MSKRKRIQLFLEISVDLLAVGAANLISFWVCSSFNKLPDFTRDNVIIYVVCLILAQLIIFLGFTSSINLLKRSRLMETVSVLRNCLLTYMLFAVLLVLTKNTLINGRYLFIGSLFLYIAFSSGGRYILKRILMFRFSNSKMASLTGVITVSERAERYIRSLKLNWVRRLEGVALLDADYDSKNNAYCGTYYERIVDGSGKVTYKASATAETIREISGVKVVANADNFIDWVRSSSLDEVFINVPYGFELDMAAAVDELESMGVIVHINLPTLENLIENSDYDNVDCQIIAGTPSATLVATTPLTPTKAFLKRAFDILGGIIGCLLTVIILAVLAIPIKLESEGPVIFRQTRIGKNGRTFNIYKIRSMYSDAEERKAELMEENDMDGNMFKMENDPRITKTGKFIRRTSLDEFPQFFNVLKGDMSLVGTRPPTLEEFENYESHHKRRLSMRPGITGMWQVSGRSEIQNFEEVVRLDTEYIDNWTPWLDIKILFKTIGVVIRGDGAK